MDLSKYEKAKEKVYYRKLGKVLNVVGLTIESAGPDARLADICYIHPEGDEGPGIMAEVVGFKDGRTLLMPYENTEGIGIGNLVENTGESLRVAVGDFLLGRTLDGLGRPAAGDVRIPPDAVTYSVEAPPPDTMSLASIYRPLPLGLIAVV